MVDIRKTITEGDNAAGGYFVPDEFATRFLALVQEKSTAVPLCETVQMHSDVMYIPTVSSGNTAYFVSEAGTITSSDVTTGRVTLTAKKIAALTQASTEVLEDSNPSISQVLTEQLAKDVALKLDNEIWTGSGTNFSGFRDTTTYTDINTVAATGDDGDAVTYNKIVDAQSEIMTDAFDGGTHIVMHPKELGMIRKLQDANSRPLFDEASWGNPMLREHPRAIGTILGLKVVTTSQLPINLSKGQGSALTDMVVLEQGNSGFFGNRRGPRFHKEYQIETDTWKIQTNIRAAFRAKYQKSICTIEDLTTS
jgi:HK97 family phage major capsid protein